MNRSVRWLMFVALCAGTLVPHSAVAQISFFPHLSQLPFAFERLEVRGADRPTSAELQRSFGWAVGDTLTAEQVDRVVQKIEGELREDGYWSADVRWETACPSGREACVVQLTIDRGQPAILNEIIVVGNRILAREEVMELLQLRPGDRFAAKRVDGGLARVARAYAERGRPLARVSGGMFRVTPEGRLSWTVQIGEGPVATIADLRVFGKTTTSPRVIHRIAGVRPGDPFDLRHVEEIGPRLRREDLFSFVGEPRIVRGPRDNELIVEVDLDERKANAITGVLGYLPKSTGGGEVVGLVDLHLGNIMGTARRAAFRVERQTKGVRELSFRYREPWILGTPLSIEGGAAQSLRDSLFSRTDLDVSGSVPLGWRGEAFLTGERREISVDNAVPDSSGLGGTIDEVSSGGSVGLTFDHRNSRLDPTQGFVWTGKLGARRTEEGITRTHTEVELGTFIPLHSRWVLAEVAAFRGIWATRDEVPLADQYFFGGTNSLRGYREEQFHGEQVYWARTEFRYRMGGGARLFAFGDVGGFVFRERTPSEGPLVRRSDTFAGGGFGLAALTRAGTLFKIELALGRGDGFSDAKVHAGLEREF